MRGHCTVFWLQRSFWGGVGGGGRGVPERLHAFYNRGRTFPVAEATFIHLFNRA